MNSKKWTSLGIYAGAAVVWLLFSGSMAGTIAQWFFIILVVAHLGEYLYMRSFLNSLNDNRPGYHFAHTMLFGYVHWLPLKQQT